MSSRFVDRLLGAHPPVLMEIKRRNAHGADLLRNRPLRQLVADYEAAGAPCLSVVTGRWFGGDDDLLREVAGLTDLPILQKDFITKESQLRRARELGASAVLLTAQVLPTSRLGPLTELALDHGLTPFVEVVNQRELDAVVHGEHCVVAVNNKDIRDRERGAADLSRSLELLPAVLRTGTRCPVSASGIDRPPDAAMLLDAGFAGLLVGTGLLAAESPRSGLDAVRANRRTGVL